MSEVSNQVTEGVEFDLNNSGQKLLGQKKLNEAIEVFKLDVNFIPIRQIHTTVWEKLMPQQAIKNLQQKTTKSQFSLMAKNEAGKKILEKLKAN